MTKKLLSTDEFRACARRGKPDGVVVRFAAEQPEAIANSRTIRFVFSDDSVDRAGDRIEAAGWDTADFMNNPVALWAHMSWEPPIGRASNVHVTGNKLVGDIEFATADVSPRADEIYRLVAAGYIRAVSVGFIPREWTFSSDKDRPYGIDFKKQELVEISVCPVPCNANALTEARAKGLLSKDMDARWVELLAAKAAADWKCSTARDLPIDEDAAWDGAAAEKAVFDACGFDGDNPDTAKAAQAFLAHDAGSPKLKGSYKLPIATIKDGKMTAVAAGIRNAAARLPQTDNLPQPVLDEAKAVIDAYEKRFTKAARSAAQGEGTNAGGGALVPPAGTCGRQQEQECGMKNPQECSVHAEAAKTAKSGRRISAATKEKLQESLGHHQKAMQCIRDLIDGDPNGDGDANGGDPNGDGDPADGGPSDDPAKRVEQTRRFLTGLNIRV